MKNYLICGIQQIGIGVTSLPEAWQWYRTHFGMDIRMFEEAAYAEYMLPYTGGQPQKRHAVLAINMQGGGGFEVWQYAERKPVYPAFTPRPGDQGIFACKMKSFDVPATHARLKRQGVKLGPLLKDPAGQDTFYVTDPWGNVFQYVACHEKFYDEGKDSGGVHGITTGVTDMEQSLEFYRDILGFDQVVYDVTATFEDFKGLEDGQKSFRRVLLSHSKPWPGPFSTLFGSAAIELVQALEGTPRKIYEDRYWGDPGFIQICFDVQGFDALREYSKAKGNAFTVNSQEKLSKSFDMGEAAGHFAYIEDPDGTLIELVETHKIPVVKKLGWYIDLSKRKMGKPLPRWMLKTLRFNRVKP